MHGRHHLAGCIEGVLADLRAFIQEPAALDPGKAARAQERSSMGSPLSSSGTLPSVALLQKTAISRRRASCRFWLSSTSLAPSEDANLSCSR